MKYHKLSLPGLTFGQCHDNCVRSLVLKGRCHGDFAVCWSKLLKSLSKNLFSNLKLLLEHRKENMKLFSPRKVPVS